LARTPHVPQNSPAARKRGTARFQTFTSLQHRDYLFLWVSNLFNASASWFQQITAPWLVWEISHSPFWAAAAAGMRSLPFLFIGPLAGVFADRIDRRKMVLVVQTVLALVVSGFAVGVQKGYVTGNAGIFYALLFAFIAGLLQSLIQPVRQAMIANTVPRQDLWNAIALNSLAGNVARVIGPGLAGILIEWLSPSVNFYIQGALYMLMALAVVPIKLPYREEITAKRSSIIANLRQGFEYVWSERLIWHLLSLSYIPALFIASILQIMPAIADDILGHGAEVFGFLLLAMGIGGIVGTICLASLGGIFNRGGTGLLALMLLSGSVIALGISTWLLVSLAAMFCLGFFRIAFQINNNTLLQTSIPDGLRGRVMALYHLDHGFTPLAGMVVGLMAELMSANLVVTLAGLASLGLALYAFLSYTDVRRLAAGGNLHQPK
jgi:predicted MFS family arabinose efflux permease